MITRSGPSSPFPFSLHNLAPPRHFPRLQLKPSSMRTFPPLVCLPDPPPASYSRFESSSLRSPIVDALRDPGLLHRLFSLPPVRHSYRVHPAGFLALLPPTLRLNLARLHLGGHPLTHQLLPCCLSAPSTLSTTLYNAISAVFEGICL